MRRTLRVVAVLALAFWVGALAFFAFGTAPAAFAALPERALAGSVVNAAMARLGALGAACGAVAALALGVRAWRGPFRRSWAPVALVLAMLGIGAASHHFVNRPLAEIRQSAKIDDLAPNDPVRRRFGRLHGISVLALGATLALGTAALGLVSAEDR